ncbi:hypothetical protein B0H14DRAFT_3524159 [Mycena olivaceomarginata]|nr:hypothetical protein B0H14DRAFT_3524159 [Mycena olivaceomarginata]
MSAVGYRTLLPHPPDPRTAAVDAAQVEAQVQAAADRSAWDKQGRPERARARNE